MTAGRSACGAATHEGASRGPANTVARWWLDGRRTSAVRTTLSTSLFCLSMLSSGSASAALFDDDEARRAILDLRTKVTQNDEQQQARLAEQKAQTNQQLEALRGSLLDLNSQLEAMREEMAKLRGSNEQLQRDVSDMQRKQRDIGQSVNDRLRKFEPQKVTLDGKDFLADPEETRQYNEALAVLRSADFDKAYLALVAFLKRWPTSGYADAVRFWQGNALYGQRNYKEAINVFRAFITQSPNNPHAPEALLAIANSQAEMKDNKAARKTLEELQRTYPTSEAAAAGKDRLAALR